MKRGGLAVKVCLRPTSQLVTKPTVLVNAKTQKKFQKTASMNQRRYNFTIRGLLNIQAVLTCRLTYKQVEPKIVQFQSLI